jgi:NAD(P)-dependent dehydrogenase (short-subunit alcohol dehydrogenase family)
MKLRNSLTIRACLFVILGLLALTPSVQAQTAQSKRLDAPTVLVTGSNRGLGLAFVQAYADKQWNVIATCRNPSKADKLQQLAADNNHIVIEALDVTDFDEVNALAAKYKGRPIDVLLNNAGILVGIERIRLGSVDYELMDNMFKVNSIGPLKVSEAFLENVAASSQKKIITMSTIGGSIGSIKGPGAYQYRASKAAVNMIMRIMSFEVADRGVIVSMIHPGMVDTRGYLDADVATLPQRVREAMPMIRKTFLRPRESVDQMITLIDGLTPEVSGQFYDYKGDTLPW